MPNISEIKRCKKCGFKECWHLAFNPEYSMTFLEFKADLKQSLISEILDHYKVCRTDEGFITYLRSLKGEPPSVY